MFKSIQKSGRIAAVTIGLLAALSPLATPPAALASDSAPTPELEKSYSFKTSSDNSYIDVIDIDSEYCYLFNRDDENNLKKVSLINMNDGSISPVDIPKKSLYSTVLSGNDQLSWIEDSNLVVFSPEKQSRSTHSLEPEKTFNTVVHGLAKTMKQHVLYSTIPKITFHMLFMTSRLIIKCRCAA